MRKIFSLLLAMSFAAGSFAQVQVNAETLKAHKSNRHPQMEVRKMDKERAMRQEVYRNNQLPTMTPERFKAAAKAAAQVADTAMYIVSYNAFRGGYYTDGWETNPTIAQPWNAEIMFANASVMAGDEFGWFLNDQLVSTDTNFVVDGTEMFDDNDEVYSLLPTLTFASGASYFMGDAWQEYYQQSYPQFSWDVYWMSLPQSINYPLTFCDFYNSAAMTESPIGWNLDYWFWDPDTKSYMWGSNFDASDYLAARGLTGRVDTIATPFGLEDVTLHVDSITLGFYALGNTLPAGSGVTLDLYPMKYDPQTGYNLIDHANKIASYKATAADTVGTYVLTPQQTGLTENLVNGVMVFPIKADITGMFVAEISGFNDNNANIGFFSDYISAGTNYHVINGEYISLWYTTLALSFNATCSQSSTALPNLKAAQTEQVRKFIHNGQIFFRKGDRIYNALGAQIMR